MFKIQNDQLNAFQIARDTEEIGKLLEWMNDNLNKDCRQIPDNDKMDYIRSVVRFCNARNIYSVESISKIMFFDLKFDLCKKSLGSESLNRLLNERKLPEYRKCSEIRNYILKNLSK